MGPSLTQRVAMPSLFLHRTSAVCVNLFVAATKHGPLGPESRSTVRVMRAHIHLRVMGDFGEAEPRSREGVSKLCL